MIRGYCFFAMELNVIRRICFGLGLLATVVFQAPVSGQATTASDAAECHARDGLPNVLHKLSVGKDVRIAYLGGSITAQPGWRVKTTAWFQKQFPDSHIDEINAAIGGTGSDLGAYRLQHDVLTHKPDLLFVEFAVNDSGAPVARILKSMEGIVRQTWRANPETDICFVYTLTQNMLATLQAGEFPRAASTMERVADYYGIPSIHMGLEVARLEQQGNILFKGPKPRTDAEKKSLAGKTVFSPDGVHPYPDTGHPFYLAAIVRGMAQFAKRGTPGPHRMKTPLVADNWEHASMVPIHQVTMSAGWTRLDLEKDPVAKRFKNRVPEMFTANQAGASISFKFKGTAAAAYDLLGPNCGQVLVQLDDQPPRLVPRFDAYCTYHRLATLGIGRDLADTVHRVHIEIHPEQPDKATILSKRQQTIDDPKRFDDTAWYVGAVLINGELVQ